MCIRDPIPLLVSGSWLRSQRAEISKASARLAGVGKDTVYRWLREAFVALRAPALPGLLDRSRPSSPGRLSGARGFEEGVAAGVVEVNELDCEHAPGPQSFHDRIGGS